METVKTRTSKVTWIGITFNIRIFVYVFSKILQNTCCLPTWIFILAANRLKNLNRFSTKTDLIGFHFAWCTSIPDSNENVHQTRWFFLQWSSLKQNRRIYGKCESMFVFKEKIVEIMQCYIYSYMKIKMIECILMHLDDRILLRLIYPL